MTSITNQNLGFNSSIEQLGNKLSTLSKPPATNPSGSNEDQKKTRQQLDYIASLVLDVQAKQVKFNLIYSNFNQVATTEEATRY